MLDKTRRKEIAGRNLVLFNELRKVLLVFQDHGIPVIVLKGAALANSVYASIGDRPMCDVDLLIHNEDRFRVLSILEETGFQIEPHPYEKFYPFNPNNTGEINFRSRNGGIFDLHWELTSSEWMKKYIRLDMIAFWQSALPLTINGIDTLQLSPADSLINICLHQMNDAYSHGVANQDVAHLIQHYHPFPWHDFLARAIATRLRTGCYIVLDASSEELGVEIPFSVLKKLRTARWKKWLIYKLSDPIKSPQNDVFYRNKAYLVKLISADGLQDVMKALGFLFIPGPTWLAERYHISRGFQAWLACIWHPINIIYRGCMGLWEVFEFIIRKLTARNQGEKIASD
jgi:hypothetical protein